MYTTGGPSAVSSLDSLLLAGSSLPCAVKEHTSLQGELYARKWQGWARDMLESHPEQGRLLTALDELERVRENLPLNEQLREQWEVKEEKKVIELSKKAESWLER